MCGIAGIVGFGGGDAAPRVGRMLDALRHRGPDGRGEVAFPGGAAGMVRLALLDLSERGQQPLWGAERRAAIVFNGEMYNHAAERARLRRSGYPFRSGSDAEVVLALYLEDPQQFLSRVRGMFALAIFDFRDRPAESPRVVLARDPLGIKPLYLHRSPAGAVVIASEIRAMLASGLVEPQVDREALADFFSYGFVPQPRTILEAVEMLEPGTVLRLGGGAARPVERFWTMPPYAPLNESLAQAAERLRAVLEESVALHSVADAPVGAFLSGGIDSSAIVALMAKQNPRLRTYGLRATDAPEQDETPLAREFAARVGCEFTAVEVDGRELESLLPRFASELDQPSTDGLNTWLVSRRAGRDVRGVLSGLGGDEWFAGYPIAGRVLPRGPVSHALNRAASLGARMARPLVPPGRVREKADALADRRSPQARWVASRRVFPRVVARRMVAAGQAREDEADRIARAAGVRVDGETPLGVVSLLDAGVYMRSQLLRDSDASSMASSLELRVPFVDVELAKFARSCRDEWKRTRADGSKRVLVEALRDLLPREILERPKRGFALPYAQWLAGPLAPVAREACSREVLERRGLVDPDELDAARQPDGALPAHRQWALTVLELWCRAVLDERRREALPRPLERHAG